MIYYKMLRFEKYHGDPLIIHLHYPEKDLVEHLPYQQWQYNRSGMNMSCIGRCENDMIYLKFSSKPQDVRVATLAKLI